MSTLGVTEITDTSAINDFLEIDAPTLDLETKSKDPVPPAPKNNQANQNIVIDETDLFTDINVEEEVMPGDDNKGDDKPKKDVIAPINENPSELSEDEIFSQLGEGLSKLGVVLKPEEADFKWNQENFIKQLEVSQQEKAKELLGDVISEVDGGEELFKALFIDKIPVDKYAQYAQQELDYANVDIINGENAEKNQERIVRDYLKSLGHEDKEIEENIEYLKDTDKLQGNAEKYKAKLVEKVKKEREAEQNKTAALEQAKKIQKKQFDSSIAEQLREAVKAKELDGFPINDKEANELFKYATHYTHIIESTKQPITEFDKDFLEIKKDPAKFVKLVKLVKEGLNVKQAVKKEVSKETGKIFNFVTKTSNKSIQNSGDAFLEIFGKK